MSVDDNYLKILEKISEVKENVGVLNNEMMHIKSNVSEIAEQITQINKQDTEQNRLLDEHILGVKTAMERLEFEKEARERKQKEIQKQIDDIHLRLEDAEFPKKVLHAVKRTAKWITAIGAAIMVVLKLLKVF